jgi:O-antigen/teichoic acid export membrane protein
MRASMPAAFFARAVAPAARALRADARAGLLYVAGEAAGRALGYAALLGWALVLPVEQFGALSLYLAVVALLTIPGSLGLPAALVRFRFRAEPFAAVLGTAALLGLGSAIAFGLAVALARGPLALFVGVAPALIALAALGAPAQALRQAWLASLRARTRARSHTLSQLAEPLLLLLLLGALVASGAPREAVAAAGSCTAATLAIGLVGLAAWRRDPGLRFDPALCAPLLRFSVPLVAHTFSMAALASFDQLVVRQSLGEHATGIYAFAYRVGMAMQAVCLGFSSWWTPRLLELLAARAPRERIDALAQRSADALLAAAAVGMLALPPLARLLGGERYAEGAALVPIIVYGYVWFALYVFAVGYSLHAERTARIALGSALAMATNVGLNYLLVPRLGLAAAAVLTVVGYGVLFATQWVGARTLGAEIRFARLAGKALAFAPLAAAAYFWARP